MAKLRMKRRLSLTCIFLASINLISLRKLAVYGYPMMMELDANEGTCFNYNIPEDDDANLIVVPIPKEDASDELQQLQDYFIDKFLELSADGGAEMPKQMVPLSDEIEKRIDANNANKEKHKNAGVGFTCFRDEGQLIDRRMVTFYKPYILHSIVEASNAKGYDDYLPLDGFTFCFKNLSKEAITLILDLTHWLDPDDDDGKNKKNEIVKKEHITPLESNFQQSIGSAKNIIHEMRYSEKRERSNKDADEWTRSIVDKFSFLSIAVLILTASVQVKYLKSYFKKKKLL